MTQRERFYKTMHFGNPDRPTHWDFEPWAQTLERWHGEGLPEDVHLNNNIEFESRFGFDRHEIVPVLNPMFPTIPPFKEEVIEETDRYIIRRRNDGVTTRALKEGSVGGARASMDQHIQYPVRDRASWNEFKKRLDPKSPARRLNYWDDYKRCMRGRDYPIFVAGGSLFGWPRNWMGLETASTMLYDDPGLMHEIMDHITDFVIEIITPALAEIGDVDFGMFWEDMCYKTGSMISPRLFREFMLPRYKRIVEVFHRCGVDVLMVDSDGHVDELIPLWLEAGINCVYPLEVAAGEDPVALRKEYGRDLLLRGGIDKRALALDKQAIDQELYSKVPFLVEQGGWIPSLDHGVPPDVPYANYLYYLDLLRRLCDRG